MAGADYRHCDVCQGKAFYDADLDYGTDPINGGVLYNGTSSLSTLGNLGEWAVICKECAKTHRAIAVTKGTARAFYAAHALFEALEMVRDADEDCKRDGLPTIPAPARRRIDAALAKARGEQ